MPVRDNGEEGYCPATGRSAISSPIARHYDVRSVPASTRGLPGHVKSDKVWDTRTMPRSCTKAYYVDQATARNALAGIHDKATLRGKAGSLPVRVYPCDVCDGWHLTAKQNQGRKPAWDRDPDWTRPGGTAHLQQRSAEVVTGSRRQRKKARAAARNPASSTT